MCWLLGMPFPATVIFEVRSWRRATLLIPLLLSLSSFRSQASSSLRSFTLFHIRITGSSAFLSLRARLCSHIAVMCSHSLCSCHPLSLSIHFSVSVIFFRLYLVLRATFCVLRSFLFLPFLPPSLLPHPSSPLLSDHRHSIVSPLRARYCVLWGRRAWERPPSDSQSRELSIGENDGGTASKGPADA